LIDVSIDISSWHNPLIADLKKTWASDA